MQPMQMMRGVMIASGALVLAASVAGAQVFRQASTFQLSGSTSDVTSLFVLADVGSNDGPLDGHLDVVAPGQNQLATILFGRGDGIFEFGPNTILDRIPSALAVADFNGDGLPDMLVGDVSNTLAFYAGTGSSSATFVLQGDPIPAGTGPVAIAAADVNGDGKLDALVVNEGTGVGGNGGVTVLLGGGDGTFEPFTEMFPAGMESTAIVVGDFNRDGPLDLAVVNKVSNTVTVMRGAGNGFFTTTQTIATGQEPIAIAAADLNGDGRLDLVVTNRISDNLAVIDGLASGAFGTARFFSSSSAGSSPTGLALADVNLDGDIDALVPNNRSSDVSVLLGDGQGNFAAPRAFVADQEPLAVAAGDVNGDGVADAVSANRGSGVPNIAVLLSRVDGSLEAVEDVIANPSPTSLTAGDVDNDGVSDLILAHSSAGTEGGIILVYRAQPPVGFGPPLALRASGDAVAVAHGDFNADGRLDFAVVNKSTQDVSVFLGRPRGGFTGPSNYLVGAGASALAVGDWNRDGRSDLAIAEQGTTTGAVRILLAGANGTFTPCTTAACLFPVGTGPVSIDKGDFNGDGRLDLAVANNSSGDVSILRGIGNGTFAALTPIPDLSGPKAIVVADFDRDGNDDIAVAQSVVSSVVPYFGNGQGGFTRGPASLPISGGSPAALAARDLNGDAIPDLMVADEVSNLVAVFRGGLGVDRRRFVREDEPIVSRRPISIAAADFDDDGRYDAAAADNFVAGSVSVLTNVLQSAALPVARGDGNGDGTLSAADAVAVMRELADGNGTRIEDVRRGGSFTAMPGVDANGDGVVTPQDALAVAHRLFPRS